MGDADSKNLTLSILKIVSKKMFEKFNFNILIGNANSKRLKIMKNFRHKKILLAMTFNRLLKKY